MSGCVSKVCRITDRFSMGHSFKSYQLAFYDADHNKGLTKQVSDCIFIGYLENRQALMMGLMDGPWTLEVRAKSTHCGCRDL